MEVALLAVTLSLLTAASAQALCCLVEGDVSLTRLSRDRARSYHRWFDVVLTVDAGCGARHSRT